MAKASDPRSVKALLDSLNKPAPAAQPAAAPDDGTEPAPTPAPVPEPPAAAPEPTPEPTPEPAAGDPPADPNAPEPEPTPEPAHTPEPPLDPDADPADGEITPVSADRARLRLNKDDDVGRMAAAFKIRNKDWTLEQCLDAAKAKLGVKPAGTPAPNAPTNPDLPQTVAAVDSAIDQLEADKIAAAKELDVTKVAELDVKIRKMDRHRETLEKQAERQETQRATEYDTQFTASETRAADFYPDAAKPDSPFGRRMVEIEESLKELGDPLYFSPEKPLKVAQMVASELNIAPRKPGAKAPAPAPRPAAPKPAATPPKGILPTGGSKTAPAPAVNPVADKIQAAKTPNDVHQLLRSLGKRDF